jgi:hypothetical protein
MPTTTITNFPLVGKNPLDTQYTALTMPTTDVYIILVLSTTNTPACVTISDFTKWQQQNEGVLKIAAQKYIDDDAAIAGGVAIGTWYELDNGTNYPAGMRTLRILR